MSNIVRTEAVHLVSAVTLAVAASIAMPAGAQNAKTASAATCCRGQFLHSPIARGPTTTTCWRTNTRTWPTPTAVPSTPRGLSKSTSWLSNADPASKYLNSGLAELYFRTGHVRDAILAAQDEIKKDPNNLEAHKLLGSIYLRSLGDGQQNGPSEEMLKLAIAEYIEDRLS